LAAAPVAVIKERDGIHIDGERKVVADGRSSSGDINFVSHAHFDHLHQGSEEVLCSGVTARLTEARTGEEVRKLSGVDGIEMLESGHIIGSRAALVRGDRDVLYTGDVSLRDRLYLEGFEPVEAEVLVVESTYGIPSYSFPPQEEVERRIREWLENEERPMLLFGYSLGKAQKIQKLVEETVDRPLLVHGAVKKMNDAVEEATQLSFDAVPYGENRERLEDGVLVAPSRLSNSDWADELVEDFDAVKAGFSGWAAQDSFRYRGDYDRAFTLSDHCGFDELVELVEEVDPDRVYTHHGFDEAFASYLRREQGLSARTLKKNQSTLDDF
ncbi:MAG: mRNA cleavage and polyadenylation specificity factor-like protein, partial [Candidatus Nanohaloarchaea archaeon]